MSNGKGTGIFFENDFSPTDEKGFVSYYSDKYYTKYKNSKWVEDQIDKILKNGIKTKEDVVKILAWKNGKIIHSKSKKEFVYVEKWKNAEENGGTNQKDLIKYIVDNIETLKKDAPIILRKF